MRILDLLDRNESLPSYQPQRTLAFDATLDRIDQLWLDGALYDDETEVLSYLSYRLRHSPSYRISESLLAAIEVIRRRVAETSSLAD